MFEMYDPVYITVACGVKASVLLRVCVSCNVGEVDVSIHVSCSNAEDEAHDVVLPKPDINPSFAEVS
jgi:hypothetical protein